MNLFQVIFNDVPLAKSHLIWETVYMPKQVIFEVNEYEELYSKIDEFIIETNIRFSSYEIFKLK
jgi:hypothetical protein